MSDIAHTIVAVTMLYGAHMWGYWRAATTERTQGIRECLFTLQEMGIIGQFNIEEIEEEENDGH